MGGFNAERVAMRTADAQIMSEQNAPSAFSA